MSNPLRMACRASRLQSKAITAQLVYTWRGARAVTSNGWHSLLTASNHQFWDVLKPAPDWTARQRCTQFTQPEKLHMRVLITGSTGLLGCALRITTIHSHPRTD